MLLSYMILNVNSNEWCLFLVVVTKMRILPVLESNLVCNLRIFARFYKYKYFNAKNLLLMPCCHLELTKNISILRNKVLWNLSFWWSEV